MTSSQKTEWVYSGTNTHPHLLTYLPRTHTGKLTEKCSNPTFTTKRTSDWLFSLMNYGAVYKLNDWLNDWSQSRQICLPRILLVWQSVPGLWPDHGRSLPTTTVDLSPQSTRWCHRRRGHMHGLSSHLTTTMHTTTKCLNDKLKLPLT